MTNLMTLIYTHASKFYTKQNNTAKIKKIIEYNESWKSEIYIHVHKFNTEQNNMAKIIT
jgi:hypothetical protein